MISNTLQSDYVLSLFAAEISFRRIAHIWLQDFEELDCVSKAGFVSDIEMSYFSRIAFAIGLNVVGDVM